MNTTVAETKRTTVVWLAGWVIASALGLGLGFVLPLPVLWSISESIKPLFPEWIAAVLFGALFGLGMGTFVGITQWIVLRMRGETRMRWVGASILGAMIGGIAAVLLGNMAQANQNNPLIAFVGFGVLGAMLGATQYALVRPVAKNVLWIVASAVGVVLAAVGPFGLADMPIWAFVMGALVYGLVTAAALWWFAKA